MKAPSLRCLALVLAVMLALSSSASAGDAPQLGAPPRLVIASRIDADGNLVVSATEQRKKTVSREVERDNKKTTQDVTVTFPVTVLGRQAVSLKDATVYDRDGMKVSIEQARERLKEPMPVLITILGEKVDPLYLKIMTNDTLTFSFPLIPEFKDLPRQPLVGLAADEAKSRGTVTVGDKVPDFPVRTLDGRAVKLSELRKDRQRTKKGVVVLSFWCSTCSSCRGVEPHLGKLAKDYDGQAAVIALDANAGETAVYVAAFAKEKGLAMPIVLDAGSHTPDVFGTDVTTTTVLIDEDGVLRYCGRFWQAEEALKAVLAGKEVAEKTTPHEG